MRVRVVNGAWVCVVRCAGVRCVACGRVGVGGRTCAWARAGVCARAGVGVRVRVGAGVGLGWGFCFYFFIFCIFGFFWGFLCFSLYF